MRSIGLQAAVITYNATISACEKGQQWQLALGPPLLAEMGTARVPTHVSSDSLQR